MDIADLVDKLAKVPTKIQSLRIRIDAVPGLTGDVMKADWPKQIGQSCWYGIHLHDTNVNIAGVTRGTPEFDEKALTIAGTHCGWQAHIDGITNPKNVSKLEYADLQPAA